MGRYPHSTKIKITQLSLIDPPRVVPVRNDVDVGGGDPCAATVYSNAVRRDPLRGIAGDAGGQSLVVRII